PAATADAPARAGAGAVNEGVTTWRAADVGPPLACFLLPLHNLDLLGFINDDFRTVLVELHGTRGTNRLALEVRGRILDLGLLQAFDAVLADEDGEVVFFLVVLPGIEEEHVLPLADRGDLHLDGALLVDFLGGGLRRDRFAVVACRGDEQG